jgi:hypothetical protein
MSWVGGAAPSAHSPPKGRRADTRYRPESSHTRTSLPGMLLTNYSFLPPGTHHLGQSPRCHPRSPVNPKHSPEGEAGRCLGYPGSPPMGTGFLPPTSGSRIEWIRPRSRPGDKTRRHGKTTVTRATRPPCTAHKGPRSEATGGRGPRTTNHTYLPLHTLLTNLLALPTLRGVDLGWRDPLLFARQVVTDIWSYSQI